MNADVLRAVPWIPVIILCVVSIAIVVPLTIRTLKRPTAEDRSNDNLYTAGLRLAGGALIFIGSFGAVSIWQAQRDFDQRLAKEFQSAVDLMQQAGMADDQLGSAVAGLVLQYATIVDQEELPYAGDLTRSEDADAIVMGLRQTVADDAVPNASQLTGALNAFAQARTERLSWQSSLALGILVPAVIVALVTLVLIGLYPAGRGREAKVIQVAGMTVVVIGILAMVIIVASPAVSVAESTGDLRSFLGTLGR